MKKKFKQSIIGTLIIYCTLLALEVNEISLITSFVVSAILVTIGFKRLKPLIVFSVVSIVILIAIVQPGEFIETISVLIKLAVAVGTSVALFVWGHKKQYKLFLK